MLKQLLSLAQYPILCYFCTVTNSGACTHRALATSKAWCKEDSSTYTKNLTKNKYEEPNQKQKYRKQTKLSRCVWEFFWHIYYHPENRARSLEHVGTLNPCLCESFIQSSLCQTHSSHWTEKTRQTVGLSTGRETLWTQSTGCAFQNTSAWTEEGIWNSHLVTNRRTNWKPLEIHFFHCKLHRAQYKWALGDEAKFAGQSWWIGWCWGQGEGEEEHLSPRIGHGI